MQGDLNLTFSNYFDFKANCHPIPSTKNPRRQSYQFTRHKNKSALSGRELQLSSPASTVHKKTAGTSQLNSRYKKILRDKKLSYQRKFSDILMDDLAKKDTKLLTDSSTHSPEKQQRAGSSAL